MSRVQSRTPCGRFVRDPYVTVDITERLPLLTIGGEITNPDAILSSERPVCWRQLRWVAAWMSFPGSMMS